MHNKCLRSGIGLAATLALATLGAGGAEAAELAFKFNFKTSDGDLFRLNLTTENMLTTQSFPSFIDPAWNPASNLESQAYTFTGYRITSVSGTENNINPITSILPIGTSISAFVDTIAHSATDNLFNPNGGFISPILPSGAQGGKFSFGGLAFRVGGTENEDYQVFTDPTIGSNYGNYAGCPGTCVVAVEHQASTFGSRVPLVTSVPGKEYSARPDIDALGTLDPEQTLRWDGFGNVGDGFDYGGNGEVDAMANNVDALFDEVTTNQAALLFSTVGDGRIFYEDIFGQWGIWATPQQINAANPPSDVDGLEVWGPIGVPVPDIIPDANRYSLADDVTVGGSVFAEGGGVIYTPAQIAAAIGRPDLAGVIDLDGLMVKEDTRLMFSIAAVDVFDGGEIWVWDGVSPANFLNHGGNLWNTAFDVQGTFGTASEDVNGLEAIAVVPEPLTLLGASAAIAFGAGFKRRKKQG
jgi:hypothetical protein